VNQNHDGGEEEAEQHQHDGDDELRPNELLVKVCIRCIGA
jgi:hypothetical protein